MELTATYGEYDGQRCNYMSSATEVTAVGERQQTEGNGLSMRGGGHSREGYAKKKQGRQGMIGQGNGVWTHLKCGPQSFLKDFLKVGASHQNLRVFCER